MQAKHRVLALTSFACLATAGVIVACSGDDATGAAPAADGGITTDASPAPTTTGTDTPPIAIPSTEEDAGDVQDAGPIDLDGGAIDDPDPEDDAGDGGGPVACNTLTATDKRTAACTTKVTRLGGGVLADGTYDLVSVTVPQKACDVFTETTHTGKLVISGAGTAKPTFQYYVTSAAGAKRPSSIRRTFNVTKDDATPLDVSFTCPAAAPADSWGYATGDEKGGRFVTLLAPYYGASAYFRFVKGGPAITL